MCSLFHVERFTWNVNHFIMPIPAAALVAGAQAGGSFLNSQAQAQQNMQSQEFSRVMYEKQRRDNIEFWQMQNEYNSPQAQMKRFQEAGLNPHLIYGQGNPGNASPISTPDVQSPSFRSPEWGNAISAGGLSYINAIYDLDIKQAQIENLRAQNTVINEEAQLKAAYRNRSVFDLGLESELRPVSADARREQLRQLRTNIDLSINKDIREAALNASNVKEAAERMLTMQAQRTRIPYDIKHTQADTARLRKSVELMEQDGTLKEFDIALRRQGINPNDPLWARYVGMFLQDIYDGEITPSSIAGSVWKWLMTPKGTSKYNPR